MLTKEVADPRIGFATITDVETAPDLRHAKVWVSVIGQTGERDARPSGARSRRCRSSGASWATGCASSASRSSTSALDDTAERGTRVLKLLAELEEGRDARRRRPPAKRCRRPSRACPTRATPTTPRRRRTRPAATRVRRRAGDAPATAARSRRGRRRRRGETRRETVDLSACPRRPRGARRAAPRGPPGPRRQPREPRCRHARRRARRRTIVSALGGEATAVSTDPVPPLYDFLPGIEPVRPDPEPGVTYDLVVVSRLRHLERVGAIARASCRPVRGAATDRHRPSRVQRRGRRRRLDRAGCAAARARWSRCSRHGSGCRSTRDDGALATALMAGIVMDTATFAHPNATPRTLAVAAALVAAGAPLSEIAAGSTGPSPTRSSASSAVCSTASRPRPMDASSGRACSTPTTRRPAPIRAHSEGIIDLLSQAEAAEVAIVFKQAGPADTRISVRTKPGGVDATVLTGRVRRWGARACRGGDRRRAAARGRAGGRAGGGAPAGRRGGPLSPRGPRPPGLDGVLVVAKPAGPTSHDVVALVRRLSATRRVGHGGTLDPFASGVLPVFLGHATRLAEYHLGDRKGYTATICFGEGSTTDDLEGERTPATGPHPTARRSRRHCRGSSGSSPRCRPAFSAVQVAGRRAYAARAGGRHARARAAQRDHPRLALVEWDASDPARPIAVVDVSCSAGTYIRSLARDLGEALGNAAYLGALARTRAGSFTIDDALPLDTLREAANDGLEAVQRLLRPVDAGLEHLPAADIAEHDVPRLAAGLPVRAVAVLDDATSEAPVVRIRVVDGPIVAIGHVDGGRLAPDKVLVDRWIGTEAATTAAPAETGATPG